MSSKRLRWISFAVAGFLAVAGVVLLASSPRRETGEAVADVTERAAPVVRVTALQVTRRAVRERIRLSATVKAVRRVTVSAEIDGRILQLGAQEHERVSEAQTLVLLDPAIRAALLERAEAAIIRARSAHRLAELELERQNSLREKGVASQAELDRAASEERATFGAWREVEALRIEATENLKKTTIHAPFDGVLTRLLPEVGDQVHAGEVLGEVMDLARIELDLGVTESELIEMRVGDSAEIRTPLYPARTFPAHIEHLGSAIDPVTKKFPVVITAANAEGLLLPGMVVEASAEIGDEEPALLVPRQTVREEFGLSYVFVVHDREDGLTVAHRRRVIGRPVAFRPGEVEIVAGLEAGERIVASGLRDVRDGAAVTVEETI